MLNLDLRHDLHASLLMKTSELLLKYFILFCFLNQKLHHNPHVYYGMYKVIIFFIQEESNPLKYVVVAIQNHNHWSKTQPFRGAVEANNIILGCVYH